MSIREIGKSNGKGVSGLVVGALLLLGLLAGAAAGAESLEGVAIVLEKDVAHGTILIEPSRTTIHVTSETEITGLEGEPIEFMALPTATKVEGGGYELGGDLTIAYEATQSGDQVTAHRIQRVQGVMH